MDVNVRKDEADVLETAVKLVRFLLKNLIWVLLFPALGLVVAYFLTLKQPVQYESQLVLRVSMVSEEEMGLILQNYSRVGIPGISGHEKNGELRGFNFRVYTKDNSIFAIITSVATDTSMLRNIHEGIPEQLNREDLVVAYLDVNRSYAAETLQEYRGKIQIIEGILQSKKDGVRSTSLELVDLYSKVEELELRLRQKSLIKVVTRFSAIQLPSSKTWSLLKGLGAGLMLSMVFLGIKSFIIYYRKSVNESL